MNWRLFLAAGLLAGLVLGFSPAFSQPTGTPTISLDHYFQVTPLGFGLVNESITFKNNGTSSVQIPTLQVGYPHKVSSRVSDFSVSPAGQFSLSQSVSNGNTTETITPNQPTLAPGANSTVELNGVVSDIFNFSNAHYNINGTAKLLVMYAPTLNVNVSRIASALLLPADAVASPLPSTWTLSTSNGSYIGVQTAVRPTASEGYINFTATNEGDFTPISVTSLARTIVPSANGSPMVQDEFSIHNIGSYNITQIHLALLDPSLSKVTEIPSSTPPLLNPTVIDLSSGELTFATANMGSALDAESNVTLTLTYPVPASLMSVSGSTVKITVPYAPLISYPVTNYSITLASSHGITPTGQTAYRDLSVTPATPGNVVFQYSVAVGWAANQAIPAGILVFAVAFAMFAIQTPTASREESEKVVRKTSDVIRAFEEKTGLEAQYMEQFASASKGSIGKSDFDRMRNEVVELRARAIQRLNLMKNELGSGRQYDSLTRVADAEKEEDRAFRDYLNLYMQYHGNRMNEETFRRLQPNYRKRVDSAINHLSDLLHETQTEER